MKVMIVGGQYGYASLFRKYEWEVVESLQETPDLLCFTGGEDVSPKLYNEVPHPRTFFNPVRDSVEKEIFNIAVSKEIPCVGICRGGQFLNVLSGGSMYQDVSQHTRDHYIKDVDTGMLIFASSTHHQMMRPGPGATIVAVANEGGYKEHMENAIIKRIDELEDDIEVLHYPLTKSLCFQPHPEFNNMDELQDYFFHCVKTYLF